MLNANTKQMPSLYCVLQVPKMPELMTEKNFKCNKVPSDLNIQSTLVISNSKGPSKNSSRYPYFDISDL